MKTAEKTKTMNSPAWRNRCAVNNSRCLIILVIHKLILCRDEPIPIRDWIDEWLVVSLHLVSLHHSCISCIILVSWSCGPSSGSLMESFSDRDRPREYTRDSNTQPSDHLLSDNLNICILIDRLCHLNKITDFFVRPFTHVWFQKEVLVVVIFVPRGSYTVIADETLYSSNMWDTW